MVIVLGDEGQYAYFESTGLGTSFMDLMYSRTFFTHGYCMSFWYHMYGSDIGTLWISNGGSGSVPLWSKSGDQGDQWFNVNVTVHEDKTHPYRRGYMVCILLIDIIYLIIYFARWICNLAFSTSAKSLAKYLLHFECFDS